MSLEEKRFYIYPQELFDDEDFTRLDLIIYGRIKCLKKGMLLNYEKAAQMFGVSEVSMKRAVPKLIQKGWLIRKGRILFTLDQPFKKSIKNDTEEKQKVSFLIPEKYQKRDFSSIKNDTHNSIKNNIKNKEEESTSNEALHTPIDDQIDGSKKAPKLNMKEQLKGARLVTDDKGRQGLVLPNGSKQIKSYPNIFLLPTQYTELQETYEKEFSELVPQKYLKWSLNRLNEWIDQNPAKANRYMGHFKVLNDGWVLSAAKVEYNIDLRNNNIKNSMNRGNRD